jgi:hypothetical protein
MTSTLVFRDKSIFTSAWVFALIPALMSCGLFYSDVHEVNGKIDNSDSACQSFQFEMALSVAGLSGTNAIRSGVVEAGKVAFVDYGNRISDGTNFKVSGTCTSGTQQIPLSLEVKQTERFIGWTVKIVDPTSPKLTFPCSLCK